MFIHVSEGEQALIGYWEEDPQTYWRIAKDISFQLRHEAIVAKRLQEFQLSNFSKFIGELQTVWLKGDSIKVKAENLTQSPESGAIQIFAQQIEFYQNTISLREWLEKKPDKVAIYNILLQILGAVRQAYEKCKFTHYDLHIDNILLCKREQELVKGKIYKFADGSSIFAIISEYEPIIIDYGRAFVDTLLNCPAAMELYNTQVGIITVEPNEVYDTLFLLNSAARTMKKNKNRSLEYNLRPFVSKLDEYGWLISNDSSAGDILANSVKGIAHKSQTFSSYGIFALNIFTYLTVLPFEPLPKDNESVIHYWRHYFAKFVEQWCLVEKWLNSPREMLGQLCVLVNLLSDQRPNYLNSSTRADTIQLISASFGFEDVGINWSEFVRSAYLAGRMAEALFYQVINRQSAQFNKAIKCSLSKVYALLKQDIGLDNLRNINIEISQ